MSGRQYNMYNVQLSEFWKQRCTKEGIHNAPYLFDEENDDAVSEAPSRAVSQLSTTSTVTHSSRVDSAPTATSAGRCANSALDDALRMPLPDTRPSKRTASGQR